MINTVRNTVLAIANKQNFGYISPADFNLYAKQAQLDLFENYFYRYNEWISKQNARISGSGYADIVKNLEEVIDTFSVEGILFKGANNAYKMPNEDNNDSIYYLLDKVLVYDNKIVSGSLTTLGSTVIEDSFANFISAGVSPGDVVATISDDVVYYRTVINVQSATELQLSNSLTLSSPLYAIYGNSYREAERVSHSKINLLSRSNLTAPKLNAPAYTQSELTVSLYPLTIDGVGQVKSQYIRKPKDPKWTYTSLSGGEPAFNQGAQDYQDFELPVSDEPRLISKILQYVGISIRDSDVYTAGVNEEVKTIQKQG
jgi:hypothetical protein